MLRLRAFVLSASLAALSLANAGCMSDWWGNLRGRFSNDDDAIPVMIDGTQNGEFIEGQQPIFTAPAGSYEIVPSPTPVTPQVTETRETPPMAKPTPYRPE
jgi:hypothetical protein